MASANVFKVCTETSSNSKNLSIKLKLFPVFFMTYPAYPVYFSSKIKIYLLKRSLVKSVHTIFIMSPDETLGQKS